MFKNAQTLAVILAGGSGTRLAPLSLTFGNNLPKQFLALAKKNTILQEAVNRIPAEIPKIIIPEERYKEEVLKQTENKVEVVAEPFGCNTATAIGLAAIFALSKGYDEDTILFVAPADHYMDTRVFRKYFTIAAEAAQKGKIITIGIAPDRPETGYGYIKVNKKHQHFFGTQALFEVEQFVEKPSLEVAQEYQKSGAYFWNAGMFALKISTLLKALETHMPGIYGQLMNIRPSLGTAEEAQVIRQGYEAIKQAGQNISVDYAIMEKEAKNILLIPANERLSWNDVGGWIALERYCKPTEEKNRAFNRVEFITSSDVFALNYRAEHLCKVENLQEMLVVSSGNGLFICPKTQAQRAKEIISGLEKGEKNIQIDSSNNTINNTTDIPVALIGCSGLTIDYTAEQVLVKK